MPVKPPEEKVDIDHHKRILETACYGKIGTNSYMRRVYMKDSVNSFLNHLIVERGFSQNTLHAYRNDLYQLEEYLTQSNVQRWSNVTSSHLMDYSLNIRSDKGYRNTTAARKVASIKSFFNFLVAEKFINEDPSENISSPKIGRSLPKCLSESEVTKLLDTAASGSNPEGQRGSAILELLYATGLRVSELIALNINDVTTKDAYVRCVGKGSRERIVYMYPRAMDAVKNYIENARCTLVKSKDQDALFLNTRGDRLTRQWVWVIIKNLAKQAGINKNLTPHMLRHSYATHMLRGGATLRHVQELLGHSTISTTQVYTHLNNDYIKQEYEKSHPRS